ncbi:hypothetical protein GCM10009593_16770 [Microlunatus antarcticus]
MLAHLLEAFGEPVDDDDLLGAISIAARAAICPTPPAPHTATVSPGVMSAPSAPVQAVGAASEANSAARSDTPSGTVKAPWSA